MADKVVEKTNEQPEKTSPPAKRLRRECPYCHSTRFHREEIGEYDNDGVFKVDEVQLRCVLMHHVFNEKELVVRAVL